MRARANDIKTKINELDGETLAYYWRIRKIERDRLNQWKKLLNKNLKLSIRGIKASDVFDSGL
ncbi:hypothetical protein BK004_02815 [bacterium CG10_46_32]|nr:MAG: hypothetical protein BK004_02815 [bacterium CG10_46_32]PIR56075.1 MAG: hypothetical protein COU73_02845 [Parcubacteria group bacterium CG10_big_fil_rev_8_21_14_0_10_46_32]